MSLLRRRPFIAIVLALAVAVGGATAGAVVAGGGGDGGAITGEAYDRAVEAALDFTGGGRVTETEDGDEDGAYEVEVTLEDGSQVDVHLNSNFVVISSEADEEGDDDDDDDEDGNDDD